jgi:alkylation response protein AidB-like acyl-CoA dehydrogenase
VDDPVWADVRSEVAHSVDEVAGRLWEGAGVVDQAGRLPPRNLAWLAGAGLYGIFAPLSIGGLGLAYRQGCAVVENLASACLATTFVWAQHFRFLGAVSAPAAPGHLRERWLSPAVSGRVKAGVVLTGLMPGPRRLSAERAPGGWVVTGEAPWVSGWGLVDLLLVVSRAPGEDLVTFLLDAHEQRNLTATPLALSAMNASCTVRLGFDGLFVPDDQVVGQERLEQARQSAERLRLNGSFALGLARRCCLLVGESPLDAELVRARGALDAATDAEMPSARAAACELAVRAAHVLAVYRGSGSALAGDVAERSAREAGALLVFGSRPAIRRSLLERLGAGALGSAPTRPGGP